MSSERNATDTNLPADDWRGDFDSARERVIAGWADATPSQRLQWLEEALAFAMKTGALKHRDE